MKRYSQILSLALLVLWSYAALTKLGSRAKAAASLSVIFGPDTAALLSWAVPLTEIVLTVFLLVPLLKRSGIWFSFFLLATFTGYIALVLGGRFEHTPCTCGGLLQTLSWRQHLLFNSVLMGLHLPALAWFLRHPGSWSGNSGKEVVFR